MKKLARYLSLVMSILFVAGSCQAAFTSERVARRRRSSLLLSSSDNIGSPKKGKLLVLGGTGAKLILTPCPKTIRMSVVLAALYLCLSPHSLTHSLILSLNVSSLSLPGFLGQAVCKRAALDGYQVTSLSRRGKPPSSADQLPSPSTNSIKYLAGDAREKSALVDILGEGGYVGAFYVGGKCGTTSFLFSEFLLHV